MREKLAALDGEQHSFTARVRDFSSILRDRRRVATVLLYDVYCGRELVSEHVWVVSNPEFKGVRRGHRIRFVATVVPYCRKKRVTSPDHMERDFTLSAICQLKIIRSQK
jgi:hypothetical protein